MKKLSDHILYHNLKVSFEGIDEKANIKNQAAINMRRATKALHKNNINLVGKWSSAAYLIFGDLCLITFINNSYLGLLPKLKCQI